jgi:hypothetical protein
MFAFRLLKGMLNDKQMVRARVPLFSISRVCCNLHELRKRQAGYDPQDPLRDAFSWPYNGAFEVNLMLVTRVVLTGVSIKGDSR